MNTISKIIVSVGTAIIISILSGIATYGYWKGTADEKLAGIERVVGEIKEELYKLDESLDSVEKTLEYYHGKDDGRKP